MSNNHSSTHQVGGKRDALLHAMRLIDGSLEQQGWDLPSSLWYLQRADLGGVPCLGLRFGRAFTRHPADELVGTYAPEDAEVLFLASEVWAYPDEARGDAYSVPPSEHPNRLECRFVTAFGRDGSYEMLRRVRGEAEPTVMEEVSMPASGAEAEIFGRLYESLRIHIGAAPHTTIPSVRDGMAQLQLRRSAATMLNLLAEQQSGDDGVREAGALLVAIVYGTITGETEHLSEDTRGIVEGIRETLPPDGVTWEEARLAAIEVARSEDDGERLPFLEWVDAAGFAIDVLDMEEPRRGDEIVSLVPEEVRGPVAQLLGVIGLRCTGYPPAQP